MTALGSSRVRFFYIQGALMEFKLKEPGSIIAFGYHISSDDWTKVDNEAAANKLKNNSHFVCKSSESKPETSPEEPTIVVEDASTEEPTVVEEPKPVRRRRRKAAS